MGVITLAHHKVCAVHVETEALLVRSSDLFQSHGMKALKSPGPGRKEQITDALTVGRSLIKKSNM